MLHLVAAMAVLLGIGAFAIDLSNVVLSRAQLDKAADAGALEGARVLFCDDGTVNYDGNSDCTVEGVGRLDDPALDDVLTEATEAAQLNASQGSAVEIVESGLAFGHWEFTEPGYFGTGILRGGKFTPATTNEDGEYVSSSLVDDDGNYKELSDLNTDDGHINAVQVTVQVETGEGDNQDESPIPAFFGSVLGSRGYQAQSTAVAYIGFAGRILPGEVDWPFAMCYQYVDDGCTVGRAVPDTEDTGGWTTFEQPDQGADCQGAGDAATAKSLVKDVPAVSELGAPTCAEIVSPELYMDGRPIKTINGETVLTNITYQCWSEDTFKIEGTNVVGMLDELDTDGDGQPDTPWEWVLPVIDCTTKTSGQCENWLMGAVAVEVLWIFPELNCNQLDDEAPWKMTRVVDDEGTTFTWNATDPPEDWSSIAASIDDLKAADSNAWFCWEGSSAYPDYDSTNGIHRWVSFATAFNLQNSDGNLAPVISSTLYFAPSCDDTVSIGGTGGANFGIRAEVPVLVY